MGLGDILTKLISVKELILEKAPSALDRMADVLGQMETASRDAANYLRTLGQVSALVKAPDPNEYEKFDAFINELRGLARKQPTEFIKMRGEGESDLSAVGQANLMKALLSLTAAIEDKLHDLPDEELQAPKPSE